MRLMATVRLKPLQEKPQKNEQLNLLINNIYKMASLTILDYCVGEVFIYKTPNFRSNETAEKWINKNTSHKLSQISYMTTKKEVEINYQN